MTLPRLSHLQFLAIAQLLKGPARGRELRDALHKHAVRQSGPAFYQFMAGLEDAAYVEGWYEQQVVHGQIIRERHYRLLATGRKAWQSARHFYQAAFAAAPKGLARSGLIGA